jgi:DinB superfamily
MYKTNSLLDNLYAETEIYLEKAVKSWQNMPVVDLNKQPSSNSWSAAQCIEHLNIYGRYYLPAIENAIEMALNKNLKPNDYFKSGWLGDYFYRQMLPTTEGGLKMKMKSPANAIPQPQPDAREMIAEFIDQQEKLQLLIERARQVDIGKIRIPITISKWIRLKLGDAFLFLIAHINRHILQAERAMNTTLTTH